MQSCQCFMSLGLAYFLTCAAEPAQLLLHLGKLLPLCLDHGLVLRNPRVQMLVEFLNTVLLVGQLDQLCRVRRTDAVVCDIAVEPIVLNDGGETRILRFRHRQRRCSTRIRGLSRFEPLGDFQLFVCREVEPLLILCDATDQQIPLKLLVGLIRSPDDLNNVNLHVGTDQVVVEVLLDPQKQRKESPKSANQDVDDPQNRSRFPES